jgi:hypothetical protein
MAVHESLAMKVDEDIEGRIKDVAHFIGSEGALRQDFAEIFFGVFHDRVDERQIFQTAAASLKNRQQVRMGEMGCALPETELIFGDRRAGGHQLEDRFLARSAREFGQENGIKFRACQALTQDEFAINRLAFPFLPLFAHKAPHAK